MNSHGSSTSMQWRVGFMNHAKKYMTAETFGFKVNASGAALKKKQIWSIEQGPDENWVYIKSHLGRYMTSDRFGNITVEAEEKTNDEKFIVEYSKDGKWAFKHVTHGNYLSGTDAEVRCFDKSPSDKNWWSIQLYFHPQVNLRNANRKRYAHLNKDTNELECTELIPWAVDALIVLDFTADGKYTMKTCDNRYLNCDGGLDEKDNPDGGNMFTMEIHSGCIAFKDSQGRYLTAVGKGSMKGRNKTVSKDELFSIEDSHPQVKIVSHNGKCVSIKQGVDVSANQLPDDIEDTELFQLEYLKNIDKWALRTSKNTYWSLQSTTGTVQATSAELTKDGYFAIEWLDNGKIAIKGRDDKYLSNKPTGILFSANDTLEETNKFTLTLVNRPVLVLKSEFGFVGCKGSQYVCNLSKYDVLNVESTANGSYRITGSDGKYLGIGDDKNVCVDDGPTEFYIQFCGQSMMAIKAPNGCYLKGEQNGLFRAVGEEIGTYTLWEY